MDTAELGPEKVVVSPTIAAVPEPLNRDSRPSIATDSASHNWWQMATRYRLYGVMGGAILGALLLRFRSEGHIGDAALSMIDTLSDYQKETAMIEGTASILGFLVLNSAAARTTLALAVVLGSAAPVINQISTHSGATRTARAAGR